jgi:hypothetical protein
VTVAGPIARPALSADGRFVAFSAASAPLGGTGVFLLTGTGRGARR